MATFLPSVYAFFAAAAAGCLLATVFGELRRVGTDRLTAVTLSALVATLAAAAAVVGQFGRPALLFSVFSNPGTAIFRELASLLLALLAGAAYLAALRTGATRRTGRKLSLLAAASGLILALAVGSAAVQPWRPVWNTWTLVLPTAGFAWLAGVMFAKGLGATGHKNVGPALRLLKKAEEKTIETASEPLLGERETCRLGASRRACRLLRDRLERRLRPRSARFASYVFERLALLGGRDRSERSRVLPRSSLRLRRAEAKSRFRHRFGDPRRLLRGRVATSRVGIGLMKETLRTTCKPLPP